MNGWLDIPVSQDAYVGNWETGGEAVTPLGAGQGDSHGEPLGQGGKIGKVCSDRA